MAFQGEEYLRLDGHYVLSQGLLLEIADLLVKVDPELAKKILEANR